MEVTYVLDREDYWRFNQYAMSFRRTANYVRALWIFIIVLLLAPVAFDLLRPRHDWASLARSLAIPSVVMLFYLFFYRRKVMSLASEMPSLLGEYTIGISPEGLRARTPGFEGLCFWNSFKEIVDDKQHIYLMSASIMGAIIPKRAFPTQEASEEFFNTATAYWENAKGADQVP